METGLKPSFASTSSTHGACMHLVTEVELSEFTSLSCTTVFAHANFYSATERSFFLFGHSAAHQMLREAPQTLYRKKMHFADRWAQAQICVPQAGQAEHFCFRNSAVSSAAVHIDSPSLSFASVPSALQVCLAARSLTICADMLRLPACINLDEAYTQDSFYCISL